MKAKDRSKDTLGLKVDDNGDPESAAIGTLGTLPAEPGYTEELEHWAWCIRNRAAENLPRCHPKPRFCPCVARSRQAGWQG